MRNIKKIGMFALALCLLTACVWPVCAQEAKTLYFEEKNGEMTWNNVRGSDGNWFMSFTNMVPGGEYTDALNIENGSQKTYKLYMQVIPKEQDQKKDELLEWIAMNVALDGKELYDGTASGKTYDAVNLQNVIYIGTYKPGQKGTISVNLTLDKDVGIEYCDLLTKNDWKFMVTEVTNPDQPPSDQPTNPPSVIHPPKTGDETNVQAYIAVMLCAAVILIGLNRKKIFQKNEKNS